MNKKYGKVTSSKPLKPMGAIWGVLAIVLAAAGLFVVFGNSVWQKLAEMSGASRLGVPVALSPNRDTVLTIAPQGTGVRVGSTVTIPITIGTGKNTVTGVELALRYDASKIRINGIAVGDFFQSPAILQNNIDNQKGIANYSLGSLSAKQGNGILFTISVTPKADAASTTIAFTPDTNVAAMDEGTMNVLKSKSNATLQIISR